MFVLKEITRISDQSKKTKIKKVNKEVTDRNLGLLEGVWRSLPLFFFAVSKGRRGDIASKASSPILVVQKILGYR